MDCTALPNTGTDAVPLIVGVIVLLVVGLALLVLGRRRRAVRTASLVGLVLALAVIWLPLGAPTAQAASGDCVVDPGPQHSLSVVQTSVITGMAPDVAPAAIVGRVTNLSTDDTYIFDIEVSIFAVTKAPGASAGVCNSSDYVIVNPVMTVDQSLDGGEWAVFAGASIGFVDKITNQDACQSAAVTLLYTTG